MAEIESAIVAHKINDGVKLLVYEVGVVADYWYTDDSTGLVVLMVNFWDGDIEPALQSADQAFNDTSFSFERGYPLQR